MKINKVFFYIAYLSYTTMELGVNFIMLRMNYWFVGGSEFHVLISNVRTLLGLNNKTLRLSLFAGKQICSPIV
jgi:hypothetical protein